MQGFGINKLSYEAAEKLLQLGQSPNSNISLTSIINSLIDSTSDKQKFLDKTTSVSNSTSLVISSPNRKNHTVDSIIDSNYFKNKTDVSNTQQFGNQYLKNILCMLKNSQHVN